MPNVLQMTCAKCRVASTCPSRGSSPTHLAGGRTAVFCRIVGGYGREEVDPSKLSLESLERSRRDGPCLTVAEVPVRDESGIVVHKPVTVFHHPIRHERETTDFRADMLYPRSYDENKR